MPPLCKAEAAASLPGEAAAMLYKALLSTAHMFNGLATWCQRVSTAAATLIELCYLSKLG